MPYSFSMHGPNIVKIIKAIDLMARPAGATIEDLKKALDISRRSVFRLFDTLAELNFPIDDDRNVGDGHAKHYMLADSYVSKLPNISLPNISLTPRESFLLYFLLQRDSVFADSSVESDITSLKAKLSWLLPSSAQKTSTGSRLDSFFATSPSTMKSYAGKEQLLDILLDALEQLHECQIAYRSLSHSTTKTYVVHPLKLLEHKGGLYLFVRIPKHDVIRLIAVDRVQSAKLLPSNFIYPSDFDPDALLDSAFDLTFDDPITAVIRFSPKDAPYVQERRYSANQSIVANPDGSITLTLTTSGTQDLLRWLLSFGPGAEILSPPDLRALARAELETALSHYKATL